MRSTKQQDIDQSNLSDQEGVATATAESGEVFVKTAQDPSLGDAVDAESKAVAVAKVDQEANQSNINSQSLCSASLGSSTRSHDVDQENESEQEGFALAVSEADDVTVVQEGGTLFAGEDGIDADSTAVAVATVDQDVTQSNQNNVPYA